MAKVVEGVGGFILGAMTGCSLLIVGVVVLWATREVWFERPDGDSLQYFDLMFWLGLGSAVLFLPTVLGSGLLGTWLATRYSGDSI